MTLLFVLALAVLACASQPPAFAQPPAAREQHQHGRTQPPEPAPPSLEDHTQQDADAAPLPPFIPPLTDADRAAAFPDVAGHGVHDNDVHWFALLDSLEWQETRDASAVVWGAKGWVGRDLDRLWFRSHGDVSDGRVTGADVQVLYGRAIAPWWDVVAGVRQDVRPGPARTWAAVGIQGLAPYWFEVEATAYVGAGGRTHAQLEIEYELLLTNRLILQPLVEMELYGKADPERGVGAGVSSIETGLRLRYELRREFAPYVGVVWDRKVFGTADLARSAGERTGGARLAFGVRLWM